MTSFNFWVNFLNFFTFFSQYSCCGAACASQREKGEASRRGSDSRGGKQVHKARKKEEKIKSAIKTFIEIIGVLLFTFPVTHVICMQLLMSITQQL